MSKVYEIITEAIVKKLEAGFIPWRKPWTGTASANAPRNLVTGKPYRGVNVFLLAMQGFSSPYFLTFRQVQEKGGTVKKGAHGSMVVYYGKAQGETKDGEETEYMFLKYYKVFNLTQCDGIEAPAEEPAEENPFSPIEAAEAIINGMPYRPEIRHAQQRAFYSPSFDYVNMPTRESFTGEAEFYNVLFHELAHSTGHSSRLARKGVTEATYFGSHEYSKEELCAEMTAAFLTAEAGIEAATLDNSAAYIQSWLRALKNDKTLLVRAAGQAQKAADYILDRKPAEMAAAA